jgi:serine phosphatase RsbU (regulator of sigma subunit)/anti-sigma regulatory factor (Ser/Thr protein kinase)
MLLWSNYRHDTERAREALAVRAAGAAFSADSFLEERIRILSAIAQAEPVRTGDVPGMYAYFVRLGPERLGFTGGIGWIDAAGRIRSPGTPPVDLSDRDYVRHVLRTGTPYVSRAVMGRLQEHPVIVVAVPTNGIDNRLSGIVTGLVRLDMLLTVKALQPEQVTILDRAGQVIFDEGPIDEIRLPVDMTRLASMRDDPDGGVLDGVDDPSGRPDRVVGYASAPAGSWIVLDSRPSDEVYASANRTLRSGLSVLGLAALLALLGSALIGIRLDRLARAGEAARNEAERRRRNSDRLHRLTSSLAAAIDVAEVIEVAMREARDELAADRCSIFLVEETRAGVEFVVWPGFEDTLDTTGRIPVEVRVVCRDVIMRRESVFLESPQQIAAQYPELSALVGRPDGPAWIVLPLVAAGGALAAFFLAFDESRPVAEDDRRFLGTLAEQSGVALGRALLHEETEAAERGARLLSETAAAMEQEQTFDARAARLIDALVPDFADYASLEIPGEDGGYRPVVLATADRTLEPALRELRERHALDVGHPRSLAATAEANTPYVVEDVPAAIGDFELDERTLELVHRLDPRSYACLSLRGRNRPLGGLLVGMSTASGRRLTRRDLPLLRTLSERAGLILENAVLHERERAIAGVLQESLLPPELPEIPSVRLASAFVAGGEGVEVGGDFYDAFEADDSHYLVVGDVCGRGVEAATMTALCRYTLRAAALQQPSSGPARLLEILNRSILAQIPDNSQFCTVALVRLRARDDGTLAVTVASAAHPPLLVLREDGSVEQVQPLGGLLGVFPGVHFPELELVLEPGDGILLYTDGVVESRRGVELFGEERLLALVRSMPGATPNVLVDRIVSSIHHYAGGHLTDDVALLGARYAQVAARPRERAEPSFSLTLPAQPASLALLRTTLQGWLDEFGVGETAARDIVLACNEAVANATLHAYRESAGEVSIEARIKGGAVLIEVRDSGQWLERAQDGLPPDERGRGLMLMRALMDDVRVDRSDDGTSISLRRALHEAST